MHGGGPGGKGGLSKVSSEALGRLLQWDNSDASGPGRRGRVIASLLLVLLVAGYALWALLA